MVNYQNSKIYKIIDIGGNMCYIGSTTKDFLSKRMTEHRNHYSQWKIGKAGNVSAFLIFDTYGVENCRIELIELCPCNSRDELHQREGHYIRTLLCVNKLIAGRTKQEYRADTMDKIIEYRTENREEINTNQRAYFQKNKEVILAKQKERFDCLCGKTYSRTMKSQHMQTKAHMKYMETYHIDT